MAIKKASTKKKSSTTTLTKKSSAPARKAAEKKGPAKKTATKKTTSKKTAKKAQSKVKSGTRGGNTREMNPDTGFAVGTDQDIVAQALLKGANSRADIISEMRKKLDSETRNGTAKAISGIVGIVVTKMLSRGYRLESHYQLLPPTPASKRAAARNK